MWFTYIIKCKDDSLYTGHTNDLEGRFKAHKQGRGAKYTLSHKPLELVFSEKFENKLDAQKREREIKKLSHSQKVSLVNGAS